MMNATSQTPAPSAPASWESPETIALFGGCRECARYQFGGGQSDPACRAHLAAHLRAMVKGLKTVFSAQNPERFLRAAKKGLCLMRNHSTMTAIWAAALTMVYGPTGMHKDWQDADGRPSAEALAKCPRVSQAMTDAAERTVILLDCLGRDVERMLTNRGIK
jgi:hypothetical protein